MGCAHTEPVAAEAPADVDAQNARLRQDNAALRKQVAHLEERLRFHESQGGPDEGAGPGAAGRHLPVVKLAPPGGEAPAREFRREAVTLSPLPHSSPYQAEPEPEPESLYAGAGAMTADLEPAPDASDPGVKSYRLVGSRLVDLTKKRRPAPAKKSRSRRSSHKKKADGGIVGQYEDAMSVYKSGRFADAEVAFDAFVRGHPKHDYADNALYWKGEAAYDQAHYADALAAFTEVVERYGGGNKAPDALLKIGLCYGKLGDTANARDVLTQLIAAYPKARATQIAHNKLAEF